MWGLFYFSFLTSPKTHNFSFQIFIGHYSQLFQRYTRIDNLMKQAEYVMRNACPYKISSWNNYVSTWKENLDIGFLSLHKS